MSTATTTTLHYSPKLGRFVRCVAHIQCEYGDAHTSLVGLAEGGGAVVSTHGHGQQQTVSPLVADAFSVGTAKKRTTFRKDGSKLTPLEAAAWRRTVASLLESGTVVPARIEPKLLPALGWGDAPAAAPRAKAPGRFTSPLDFQLAEKSADPGVLSQLARSADPAVRLVVAQNPATATDTLEGLATSTDKDARLYRNAAHGELTLRYQDLRDEAELAACARMDADGVFQKRLEETPSYRQLAYMPQKRWERKTIKARRTLIQAALQETGKALKLGFRIGGWTRRKTAQLVIGKKGMSFFRLPAHVAAYRSTKAVSLFMLDFLLGIAGDQKAKVRISRQLGVA
jgi:hypothetical protein